MDSVYDRILQDIGNDNKYQKRFDIIYNIIFMSLWGMAFMNIVLTLAVTPHMCKVPEKPQNISEQDWKMRNIPRFQDINGQSKFDSCLIYTNPLVNNDTEHCHDYTFDDTWYESSVPSEYNWVCDQEMNVANILAYMKVAEIIGSLFFGWFGDIYGRRLTYITSLALLLIGRLICLLAGNSYIFFLIGSCLSTIPSWTAPQSLSIISTEISSPKRRSAIATMRFASFSIGLFVLGMMYWWLRNWRIFLIVTTVPIIPFMIMSWKMIESPRWLYAQGKTEEALNILKSIAKVNKKQLDTINEKEMIRTNSNDKAKLLGILMLFSGQRLAINSILLMIVWLVTSLSYGYLILSSGERTDANPFLDFSWQGLSETPSIFFSSWIVNKIGRRYTGITAFSVSAVIWTSVSLRESSSNEWLRKWWIGTLFSIAARFQTTMSYFVVNLINMEIYPTSLRQTGIAVGNVFCGSALVCPYLLYLGRRFDSRWPGMILTTTSLIGAISVFFLPETRNAKLPETIEEAQMFGRKEKKEIQTQLKPLTA